jgi:hypothetical protein
MVLWGAHSRLRNVNLADTFGAENQALVDFLRRPVGVGNAAGQKAGGERSNGVTGRVATTKMCRDGDTGSQSVLDFWRWKAGKVKLRLILRASRVAEVSSGDGSAHHRSETQALLDI